MNTIQGYPVVDENSQQPAGFGTGYQSRDWQAYPLAAGKCARAANVPIVPKSEWKSLIEHKTQNKLWITDIADALGIPPKNQASTNYCWINAPTKGMDLWYGAAGGPKLVISASHAGSRIKRGSNVGGSGVEAVESIAEYGCATEAFWARNKQSSRHDEAADANGQLHKITLYDDLQPSDLETIYSYIFANRPVSIGIPAWGHEVLLTFLVWDGSRVVPGFDNSWGSSYGKNGRGTLSGSMLRWDEAISVAECSPATV